MIKKPHTYLNLYGTIHRFRKKSKQHRINNRGVYDIYRCEVCGITGYRYSESSFITIHQFYGQQLFSKCKLKEMTFENSAGKLIKICSKMIPCNPHPEEMVLFPSYRDTRLSVGSIHKVINPADTSLTNDNRGVWVMGRTEPMKVFNYEFVYFTKSRRMRFPEIKKRGRTNFNKNIKKGGRTRY